MKHGGDSVVLWGCFAALGTGWLAVIDRTMNFGLYQHFLQDNVRVSPHKLKIGKRKVMQHDPKRTSQSTIDG